jgi:3-oxoacyl-[acyl-carrier-protein] synthase II
VPVSGVRRAGANAGEVGNDVASAVSSAVSRLTATGLTGLIPVAAVAFAFVTYEKEVTVSRRRVVVTGLGLISPVGNNVADGWANLVAGKSGIANITKFDASKFPAR